MADHAPRPTSGGQIRPGQVRPAVWPANEPPEAAALEAGRLLFAAECRFVAGASTAATLPPTGLPEIAFVGRSNVGKSSLLNALTGRTALARVSHTPGRTRQLNFFELAARMTLVDLPGYGFASAPKHEIERWNALIGVYLKGRPTLRRTLLLIDARHGIKPIDRPIMTMLDEAAVSFQVVLTKIDKIRTTDLAACASATTAELSRHLAAHPQVHLVSAHEELGVAELRAAIAAVA